MNIAKIHKRIAAGAVDLIIVCSVSFAVTYLFTSNNSYSESDAALQEILSKAQGFLIALVVDFAYTTYLMQGEIKATIGMRFFGLKIYKENGTKAGFGTISLRYVISIFSSILLKIGYIFAFFSKRNQTFHDYVAGTVVIFEQKSSVDIFQPPYEHAPVTPGSSNLSQSTRGDAFASSSKDDDELWKAALEEYESSFRNKGLYAKIYSQKNGDESLVKAGYLKERFDQLKIEVKNKNLKREQIDTEYSQKQDAEEFIKSGQYRLKSVRGIDCIFFENGQAAIKVSDGKFRLYEDKNALENSVTNFLSSNMYLMTGMIKIIEIDTQFSIIGCPRCRQRTRVPKNKELQIICPSCNFGWNEKT